MKPRLSVVVDFIVTRLLIFLAAGVFVRFYIKSLFLSMLIALLITAAISVIVEFLFKKRKHKKRMSRERTLLMTDSLNQFLYSDHCSNTDFFASMLCSRHKVDRSDGFLVIDENVALFIKISMSRLSGGELCRYIAQARKASIKNIVILSHLTDKDAPNIIKLFPDFRVDIYDDLKIFSMLERYSVYPPILIKVKQQRMRFRDLLPIIFRRERYKGFLTSALFLVFGSIFLPYTVYYAIMTGVLILMAFLSYKEVFSKNQSKTETLL